MAGRIPRDFIDDLLARTDIVELIGSRVPLKKAGKNHQACCPFHNEKSPSFTVSADKQFYHCFGCGAHGNAVSFVMEYDKLDFPDAIEELASYNGVEVPREKGTGKPSSPQDSQNKEADFDLMEQSARFFQFQLRQHAEKYNAVDYLRQRGLSGEVAQKFSIGYAPPEWGLLLETFGKNNENIKRLLDLKLINENDKGRRYDFFRDRIMFPIRNRRGNVVGFGGRVLGDGTPKYLNSPETRLFHKGRELYGFYEVKQAHSKIERFLVVEGYMDVVALAQFGINYAVAALGTATTPEHIQMLFRNSNEVVCCYDGDNAGREAAWRAMENALPYLKDGTSLKFLFLPDGEDPDTYVRQHGQEALEQQIASAAPLSQFLFDRLLQRHQLNSQEGRASFKAAVESLLERISTADNLKLLIEHQMLKYTGQDRHSSDLTRDLAAANLNRQASNKEKSEIKSLDKAKITPMRLAIALLLENPKLALLPDLPDINQLKDLQLAGIGELIKLFNYCRENQPQNTGQIIEFWRNDPLGNWLVKLVTMEHHVEREVQADVFQDTLAKFFDQFLESRSELLLAKAQSNQLTPLEKQELQHLLLAAKK